MEEKKEDIIKNLKIVNSLTGEIGKLLDNAKGIKSVAVAINKKIGAKEKSLKAAEDLKRIEEEAARLAALEVERLAAIEEAEDKLEEPVEVKEEPKEETIAIKPFSFFRAPIRNLKPCRSANVVDIYKYITSDYAKERTEKLRAMTDKKEAKRFKAEAFDYACFSGTFATRNDKDLVEHSGLICIDFDHVPDVEALFQRLLQDEYFETQLLFRSPSGDGLKWVIPIDITEGTHKSFYESIAAYIAYTYRIDVDINCSNVSRACFLCYDDRAYIYPKLLEK